MTIHYPSVFRDKNKGGASGGHGREQRVQRPAAAVRVGETSAGGGVRVPAVREHAPRGASSDMAVQGHAPAAEEQQRAVVGVAGALRRRALVRLLLGADAVRAVEPRLPPHLPRPARPKVPILEYKLNQCIFGRSKVAPCSPFYLFGVVEIGDEVITTYIPTRI